VILSLRCPDAMPRFTGEPGLHVLKDQAGQATCLVEVSEKSPAEYTPPEKAGVRGWIEAGAARRTYDAVAKQVTDPALDVKLSFADRNFEAAVLEAIDLSMNEAAWEAMGG
jgi:hypothetical protein